MKQLVHIHGGEAFDTYEEYWRLLVDWEIDDPSTPKVEKWTKNYSEFLGDGWQIVTPQMPSAINAKYKEWKLWFEKYIPYLQDDVALVGYSLGGVFLAKYLSEEVLPIRIATLHLVAAPFGWNGGFSLDSSLKSIEKQCSHIYIYQSKDDPLVEYKDAEKLKEQLPTAELLMFEDRGHFFQPEFPELIANIQKTA